MDEPEIRPARPADLPGILALYRHLNPDDPVLTPAVAEAAWSALLSSGLTTLFVADLAGLLVSSCTLAIVPNLSRRARPYGMIENVVTHADHRRGGLGRAVLQAAIDKAWSADCYKILLATGSKKEATLRFYEGAGFDRGGKTYFEIRRP
jgi:GNAT superfamily N-acetyltransferase